MFDYEVPAGWEELPPTQFRIINLQVPAEPQPAQVSLTMLMGDGGGVRANIDRWRRQVGLAPMSQEEFLGLEERTMFDQPATYVELEGSYEGMDGTRITNAGLFGAVFARGQSALFVKMTGPSELLGAQRDPSASACSTVINFLARGFPTAIKDITSNSTGIFAKFLILSESKPPI